MAAQLTCPHCQSSLKTNKPMPGGLEVKCPKCKAAFKVPAAGIKPAKVSAAAGAIAAESSRSSAASNGSGERSNKSPIKAERPTKPDRPTKSEKSDKDPAKGMPKAALISAAVLLLAVGGGVGAWVIFGTGSPAGSAEKPGKDVVVANNDKEKEKEKENEKEREKEKEKEVEKTPDKVAAAGLIVLTEDEAKTVFELKQKGLAYLSATQDGQGGWTKPGVNPHGNDLTPFAGLTMLQCGIEPTDPRVQKIAKISRSNARSSVTLYGTCTNLLFLDKLNDPQDEPLIKSLALHLIINQDPRGAWKYLADRKLTPEQEEELVSLLTDLGNKDWKEFAAANSDRVSKLSPMVQKLALAHVKDEDPNFFKSEGAGDTDNSHAQFALLALSAARRHNKLPVDQSLNLVVKRFRNSQQPDGRWNYRGNVDPHGGKAMTSAGLMALSVGYVLKDFPQAYKTPAMDPQVQNAIKVIGNVIKDDDTKTSVYIYSMWSIERVGVLLNTDKIDGKDWYRWGLKIFKESQNPDGSWDFGGGEHGYGATADTCFALLFLQQANLFSEEIAEEIKRLDFGTPSAQPANKKE